MSQEVTIQLQDLFTEFERAYGPDLFAQRMGAFVEIIELWERVKTLEADNLALRKTVDVLESRRGDEGQ